MKFFASALLLVSLTRPSGSFLCGRLPLTKNFPFDGRRISPSRRKTTRCFDSSNNNQLESDPQRPSLSTFSNSVPFSILMAISGGILGPNLDSYHSAFGVLQYDKAITAVLWGSAENPALITSWWVPFLFGLAGVIIGWLYILLDDIFDEKAEAKSPSAPKILVGIALFTFQYWLSGILYLAGIYRSSILNIMSVIAALGFLVLDKTSAGFVTSTATAVGGPLIEAMLLTMSRNGGMGESGYHYNDLGETGFFPLWILPVYFLGGPAVGNLARGYRMLLQENQSGSKPIGCGCQVCHDTRRVPCPNCDGMGTYVATGGQSVTCTSCRARGYVICRSCFSYYDQDPEDIDAIRDLMGRMPD